LKYTVIIVRIVSKGTVQHVPQAAINKVLALLPVHSMPIVDAGVVDELDVTNSVLPHKHIVPVEFIPDLVDNTVVTAICGKPLATVPVVDNVAICIAF